MKAIILAAGETGRTLLDAPCCGFPPQYKPKCLLKVNGEPILDTNVKLLSKRGIQSIVVVGYQKENVISHAQKHSLPVTFIENSQSKTAGATKSLLRGLTRVDDDETVFAILGDVLLSDGILNRLIACEGDIAFSRNQADPREMYVAKFRKSNLGSLDKMKAYILNLDEHERGKFLGFRQYLEEHGAEDIWPNEGELQDIDHWSQVQQWELPLNKEHWHLTRIAPSFATRFGSAYLGDSEELLKFLPSNSIDLIITSIPSYESCRRNGFEPWNTDVKMDRTERNEWMEWMDTILEACSRVLKPTGNFINYWREGANTESWNHFLQLKEDVLSQYFPSSSPLLNGTEWMRFSTSNKYTDRGDASEQGKENGISVIARFSNNKDKVLDPFMGTGEYPLAAETLSRRWMGFEIRIGEMGKALSRFEKANVDLPWVSQLPSPKRDIKIFDSTSRD